MVPHRPTQLRLTFPDTVQHNALAPPVRQRCIELLSQLLSSVLIAEMRDKEESNERKDSAHPS